VPSRGWQIDANYLSTLSPRAGVRTHALFGDVARCAGGTVIVSGSHRLVHGFFRDHPPPAGIHGADSAAPACAPRRHAEHQPCAAILLSGGVDRPSMWAA
jgi:hypothetical protein